MGSYEELSKFAQTAATMAGATDVAVELKKATDIATGGLEGNMKAIQQHALTLEGYRINLMKASGATAEFADKLRVEAKGLATYGISLENLQKINIGLTESYNKAAISSVNSREKFNEERQELQKLIGFNEKFDVSMQTTIDFANKFGNSIFGSTKEVTKLSDTLFTFSRTTGQSFANVMKDFNSYSERFILTYNSMNADKGMQVFSNLDLMAKRAGTSVQNLVQSISKFDDIDTAFSSGGQINRVLSYFGGSFDTLAAANASDEEKAEMLMKSISEIGDRFNEQMTNPNARRQMLKELQQATGLGTETIVGLMNKNTNMAQDLKTLTEKPVEIQPAALSEKDRASQAMAITSLQDVHKIVEELVNLGPLTSAMEKFLSNQKAGVAVRAEEVANTVDKAMTQIIHKGDFSGAVSTFMDSGKKLMEYIKGDGGGSGGLIGDVKNAIQSGKVLDKAKEMYEKNTQFIESDAFQKRIDAGVKVLSDSAHKNQGDNIVKAIEGKFPSKQTLDGVLTLRIEDYDGKQRKDVKVLVTNGVVQR